MDILDLKEQIFLQIFFFLSLIFLRVSCSKILTHFQFCLIGFNSRLCIISLYPILFHKWCEAIRKKKRAQERESNESRDRDRRIINWSNISFWIYRLHSPHSFVGKGLGSVALSIFMAKTKEDNESFTRTRCSLDTNFALHVLETWYT